MSTNLYWEKWLEKEGEGRKKGRWNILQSFSLLLIVDQFFGNIKKKEEKKKEMEKEKKSHEEETRKEKSRSERSPEKDNRSILNVSIVVLLSLLSSSLLSTHEQWTDAV